MIEESGSRNPPLSVYEAREDVVPVWKTSDAKDVHNPFIIREGDHSAAVDVVCSPLRIPAVPWREHHAQLRAHAGDPLGLWSRRIIELPTPCTQQLRLSACEILGVTNQYGGSHVTPIGAETFRTDGIPSFPAGTFSSVDAHPGP